MTAAADDADVTMAEALLKRLGGALTVDDILILRAVSIWHRIQWELQGEREDGLDGPQRAPVISPEDKRALKLVGMPTRPGRRHDLAPKIYALDPEPVQPWLDRAEVAAGYLMSLHGIGATGQAPSYPNADDQPPLGPMDVMTVWQQISDSDPANTLSDQESRWV